MKPKFHNHLSCAFDKNEHANNAFSPKRMFLCMELPGASTNILIVEENVF